MGLMGLMGFPDLSDGSDGSPILGQPEPALRKNNGLEAVEGSFAKSKRDSAGVRTRNGVLNQQHRG